MWFFDQIIPVDDFLLFLGVNMLMSVFAYEALEL